MNNILEFDGILQGVPGTEALSIDFPYDVQSLYGVKGQVKVKVTYDGIPYRGSLAKMGHHCHFLLVRIDIRKQLGKNPGDTVKVTVEQDLEERMVDIPDDLAAAFDANPAAAEFFHTLSYTNRKEYARWITDAKRPETRSARLEKTIDMLHDKRKNPTDK